MSPTIKLPFGLTIAEFIAWCPDDGQRWQLMDGEPVATAPTLLRQAALQAEMTGLLRDHFLAVGSPCRLVVNPAVVPHVRAGSNIRIPDIGVTRRPATANDLVLREPVLLVEILSPGNARDTRANVWAYITIPSVQEILLLHADAPHAELLRRDAEGQWPSEPAMVTEGELVLESIGFRTPLGVIYGAAGLA